jgi:hypothetical protein
VIRNRLVSIQKRKGLKEIRLEMGMFDYQVMVVIGPHCHLVPYLRWLYKDPEVTLEQGEYISLGKCIKQPEYAPVIWLPRSPRTPIEYGTTAHECLHAIFYLMEWAELKPSDATWEVMTHALAWIVANILEYS